MWTIERLLGRGTFGEVRLERNTDNKEYRAVKLMWTADSALKSSYERELKALLEFSKPKHKESAVFVDFFGWFESVDSVDIAMEYLPLGDLEENVKEIGGTICEVEIKDITLQILEGLNIMHMANFAHRDLKPKVCSDRLHCSMYSISDDLQRIYLSAQGLRNGGSSSRILD